MVTGQIMLFLRHFWVTGHGAVTLLSSSALTAVTFQTLAAITARFKGPSDANLLSKLP